MESQTKVPLIWRLHSALIQHTWGSWTSVTTTCSRNLGQNWTVFVRTTHCANCKDYGWSKSVRDLLLFVTVRCHFLCSIFGVIIWLYLQRRALWVKANVWTSIGHVLHNMPNGWSCFLGEILWVCLDAERVKGEFQNMCINYSLFFSVEPSARCYLKSTLKNCK